MVTHVFVQCHLPFLPWLMTSSTFQDIKISPLSVCYQYVTTVDSFFSDTKQMDGGCVWIFVCACTCMNLASESSPVALAGNKCGLSFRLCSAWPACMIFFFFLTVCSDIPYLSPIYFNLKAPLPPLFFHLFCTIRNTKQIEIDPMISRFY